LVSAGSRYPPGPGYPEVQYPQGPGGPSVSGYPPVSGHPHVSGVQGPGYPHGPGVQGPGHPHVPGIRGPGHPPVSGHPHGPGVQGPGHPHVPGIQGLGHPQGVPLLYTIGHRCARPKSRGGRWPWHVWYRARRCGAIFGITLRFKGTSRVLCFIMLFYWVIADVLSRFF
jgi:hypothetical protein